MPDIVPVLLKDTPLSAKSGMSHTEDVGDDSQKDGWCVMKSACNASASALLTEGGILEEIFIVFEDHSNMHLGLREARGEFTWSLHEDSCEVRERIRNGEPIGWRVVFPMESGFDDLFLKCKLHRKSESIWDDLPIAPGSRCHHTKKSISPQKCHDHLRGGARLTGPGNVP
jgi:hypothetical protein